MRVKIFVSLWTLFPALHAFGWWDQSHQLIGHLAGENVTLQTRDKVLELLNEPIAYPGSIILSKNTNEFDTSASWADSIKSYTEQKTFQDIASCHFLDLSMDKSLAGRTIDDITARSALDEALTIYKINSINCLKSSIKSLIDSTQTRTKQAIALRFVIHIIGDIAQPLHSISLVNNGIKDNGGNKTLFWNTVLIPTTDGKNTRQNKLHSLWDATLGDFLQFVFNQQDIKVGKYIKSDRDLTAYYSRKIQAQANTNEILKTVCTSPQSIESWVMDSYKVAAKYAYGDLSLPWENYSLARHDVVETQIAKGAYNLTFLLDAIFDPKHALPEFQSIIDQIQNDSSIKPFVVL